MASRSKQKTTMAKLARERAVQEKRVRKQIRKDARKQTAGERPVDAGDEVDAVDADDEVDAVDADLARDLGSPSA
jgi:hypothetical protein